MKMGFGIDFDLEGIEELSADLNFSRDVLAQDLMHAVVSAGDAAIEAMQTDHPYTDRTFLLSGGMRCRQFGRATRSRAEAIVTFDAPYAKHVNDGTSKSKPYPFIPVGMAAARDELERCVTHALDVFCSARS